MREHQQPTSSREIERRLRHQVFEELARRFFASDTRLQRTWLALLVGKLPLSQLEALEVRLERKDQA